MKDTVWSAKSRWFVFNLEIEFSEWHLAGLDTQTVRLNSPVACRRFFDVRHAMCVRTPPDDEHRRGPHGGR